MTWVSGRRHFSGELPSVVARDPFSSLSVVSFISSAGPSGAQQPAKRKRPSRASGGGSSRKRAKPKAPVGVKDGEGPAKKAPARVRAPPKKPPVQQEMPPSRPGLAMSPSEMYEDY